MTAPTDPVATKLDEYLAEWGVFLDHDCAQQDCQHYQHFLEAKAALQHLIEQACQEARIDELERLHRFQGEGLPKRDYDDETDELIDERIEQLKGAPHDS